jgi:hypothetical protein
VKPIRIPNPTPAQVVELAEVLTDHFVVYGEVGYRRLPNGICVPLTSEPEQSRATHEVIRPLGFDLEERHLRRVYRTWHAKAPPKGDRIQAVRFEPDSGDCLHRMHLPQAGPFPAWKEFIERLSAPEPFMAWVWSIYELDHVGRQVLWLYGGGMDGKSVTATVLGKFLGNAAGPLDDERLSPAGRRFAAVTVWDKRLITIPDTKNPKILSSGLIHQISGRDRIQIEPKGGQAFAARPHARILIASNYRPEIARRRSETSRLLLIEVAPREGGIDALWEGRLEKELPALLSACREVYFRLCPDHGDIRLDEGASRAVEEAVADSESEFEEVAASLLEKDPSGSVRSTDLKKLVRERYPSFRTGNREWGDFLRFVCNRFGARSHRPSADPRPVVLSGVRLKTGRQDVPLPSIDASTDSSLSSSPFSQEVQVRGTRRESADGMVKRESRPVSRRQPFGRELE